MRKGKRRLTQGSKSTFRDLAKLSIEALETTLRIMYGTGIYGIVGSKGLKQIKFNFVKTVFCWL